MNRRFKLFLQFFLFTLILSFIALPARAADPDIACIASTTAAYMESVVGGADGLAHIRLLSPAFNMTSPYFQQMIQTISASPSWSSLYGVAGNAYDTLTGSVDGYVNAARPFLGGKPLMITESGWFEREQCRVNPMQPGCPPADSQGRLRTALGNLGSQVIGVNLFNAFHTSGDATFAYGVMSDTEIRNVCGSLGLSKCGVNFAQGIGQPDDIYNRAAGVPLGFVVGIMTTDPANPASSAQAAADVANALRARNITLVLRVGVQGDAGGFDDPGTYSEFLNALDPLLNGMIYAIAGPNEPETDCWASAECQGCGGTVTGASEFCYIGRPVEIRGKITWDEKCSVDDVNVPGATSYNLSANGVVVVPLSGYRDNTPPLNFSTGLTGKQNGNMANGHRCSYNCGVSGRKTTDTNNILACESVGWADHSELLGSNRCDPTSEFCSGQYRLTVQRNFQNFENAVYLGFFCNGDTTPKLTKKVFLDAPLKIADVKVKCGCSSTPVEPPDSWPFIPNSVGECSGLSVAQNAIEERPFEGMKNIAMQCDHCDDRNGVAYGAVDADGNPILPTDQIVPAAKPLPVKFAEKLAVNPMNALMTVWAATGSRTDMILPPSEGFSDVTGVLQNCNELRASNSIVGSEEYPDRSIQINYEQSQNLQLPKTVDQRLALLITNEDWTTEVCETADTHRKIKLCEIQLPDDSYISDRVPGLAAECSHRLTKEFFPYWYQYGFIAKNACAMAFGNKDAPDNTIRSKTPNDAIINISNDAQVKVAAWNDLSTGTRSALEGIYSAQSSGSTLGAFCAKLAETVLYDSDYNKAMGFGGADIEVLKFPTRTTTELFQNIKKTRGRTLNIDTQQEMCTTDVYNANSATLAQSKNAYQGRAEQVNSPVAQGQVDEWSPTALLSAKPLTILNAPTTMWNHQYRDQVDVIGLILQAISQFVQWVTTGYGTDTVPASPQGSCFLQWVGQGGDCGGNQENSCAVRADIGNCGHQYCSCGSYVGCDSTNCWDLCGGTGGEGIHCGSEICTETEFGMNGGNGGIGLSNVDCMGNIIAPLTTTVQGMRPYSSTITEGAAVKNSVLMFPTNRFQVAQGDFTHSAKASNIQGSGWDENQPPVHELSEDQGIGADYNFPYFVQKDTINMQSDTVAFPYGNGNEYSL